VCAVAVILLMLAPPARANFVFNGSFETIAAGGPTSSFSLEDPTGNENALSGWILGNTSALTSNQVLNCLVMGGTNTNVCGGNYYAADGDSSATDHGGTGGTNGGYSVPIYQNITGLTVGETYVLSFEQAAAQQSNRTGATTEQWEVEFCTTLPSVACTGSNNQFSTLMNNASHGIVPWQSDTLSFVATASSEVLEFLAIGTPNGEPPFVLLDGVDLEVAPEPATFALIGFGLLAIPLAARLRKRRKL
jgi:hypothetical protein